MTIKDIAEMAGVSVPTVSKVINNKSDVKKETRKKVKKIIDENNYIPSKTARGLVTQRTNTIGFMIPDISKNNFPELAQGIISRSRELGYSVMFVDTSSEEDLVRDSIRLLESSHVDGIIASFESRQLKELEELKKKNFPVVQIYKRWGESSIPTISLNNIKAGYDAVKYLIKAGHRAIGIITTGPESQSGFDRKLGYLKALEEFGIPVDYDLIKVIDSNYDQEQIFSSAADMLKLKQRPTAIFASQDLIAAKVYNYLLSHDYSIPDDISIVGHDNSRISEFLFPLLTTIDTHKEEIGRQSVNLLIEQIKGKNTPSEIVFESDLILRESVRTI